MAEKVTDAQEKADIATDFENVFGENADPSKLVREITWFRNILFYLGEQWISWFDEVGGWGFRFKMDTSEPTPVSNFIRDHVRSMKALIVNKKYRSRVWPNSQTMEDQDAATLGGLLLENFETAQCNESEDIKETVAFWNIMTGNGFCRTFKSLDNGCYVTNGAGKAISRGDIVNENLIPFNVAVPLMGVRLRDKSKVGIQGLKEKEWVEDTFGVKIEQGDSKNASEVEYEKKLMTLVANASPWKGRVLETNDILSKETSDLVMFREMEYRPTAKYPKGRYVAMVNGQVVKNEKKMPIEVSSDGDWEYTVTEFKYNFTPGSFWATSSIDDQISPQIIVNEIDRALASNRTSIGRPWVLTPSDINLKRKSAAGQSFLQLEYDPRDTQGVGPEVAKGTPYPQQILEERKLKLEIAQAAGGDPKNILRGEAPTSGASGKMVDILRESAEASHTPDVERFYRSWNRVKKKQLILAQGLKTSRILKKAGEGSQVLITSFVGADLHNNTDVRLELDSGVSSTRAGENEVILELVQNKFFGEIAEQPELQHELLKRLGMSWNPAITTTHQDRARLEHSMVANAKEGDILLYGEVEKIPYIRGLYAAGIDPQTQEAVVHSMDKFFKLDNHPIHFQEHVKFILSKEFKVLKPLFQLIMIAHADRHNEMIKLAEEKAMEQQAKMQALKMDQEQNTKPPQGGQPAQR